MMEGHGGCTWTRTDRTASFAARACSAHTEPTFSLGFRSATVTLAYGGPDEAALKSRRQSNQSTASKGTGPETRQSAGDDVSKFQCQEYGSCEAYQRTELNTRPRRPMC